MVTPIILREKIAELRGADLELRLNLLNDLFDLFQKTAHKRTCDIQLALDKHDFSRVAREAHTLKSSSGQLGMARVQNLCFEIESFVSAKDEEKVRELCEELNLNLLQAIDELESILAENT